MFCRECGAGISADSKFCKECGAKIGGSVKTMALTVQDLEPVASDVNQERLTKLLDMAFWHNDAGNLDAAVKACEAALVINPSSTTAHSLLATIYEKKGDDESAIAHLQVVLELNPDSFADQAKLEELRKGERVRAIQPPTGYRWIPPALSGIASAGPRLGIGDLADRKVGNVRLLPLVSSGVVTLLVLGMGVAAIRMQEKSASANPVSATGRVAAVSPEFSNQPMPQPFETPAPSPSSAAIAAGPATRTQTAGNKAPDVSSTPDVFSAADDPMMRQVFSAAEDRVLAGSGERRRRGDDGGTNAKPLPPLKAVPLEPAVVAPAPVELPKPAVSTENLPTHTVMVSDLGGSNPANSAPAGYPAAAPQADPSTPPAQPESASGNGQDSVVHVTVHEADTPTAGNSGINQGTAPVTVSPIHVDEAQAYQSYALSLQQQGDYRGAKAAYERAIRTYKAEIREGHDGDDVQRGLQACQTGLEICQQSL